MSLEKEIKKLIKSFKEVKEADPQIHEDTYLYNKGYNLAIKYNSSLVNVYSLINYYKVKPDKNLGDC